MIITLKLLVILVLFAFKGEHPTCLSVQTMQINDKNIQSTEEIYTRSQMMFHFAYKGIYIDNRNYPKELLVPNQDRL